jgi:hypothetical protein
MSNCDADVQGLVAVRRQSLVVEDVPVKGGTVIGNDQVVTSRLSVVGDRNRLLNHVGDRVELFDLQSEMSDGQASRTLLPLTPRML